MKNYPGRWIALAVMVVILLTFTGAALAQAEVVEITHPAADGMVSGVVNVTGTIDFPDFMKYEMFLKSTEDLVWAATVYAPVINGHLAQIDTRTYPDGIYQLVVRTVRTDSNYNEYIGPSFIIENNLGAPQAYPEMLASPLYAPVAGALARISNCSGDNLSITYGSPVGFCSADDLWIPYKNQDSPVCPYVDVLLIPCEYRGTAVGQGQARGASYGFTAEHGKIYELIFSGGDKLYIAETKGTERAETDTGHLPPEDPARSQPIAAADTNASETMAVVDQTATEPTPAPADSKDSQAVLPVSGQGQISSAPFVGVAVGVILFLIIGGVVALRKRGNPA